ncbi:hypothetical protein FOMPIDRAFT_87163 [Fomitopsis schrenkii]|uniref:Fungal-type protein kinase domain-containing protein n=1 Tax=Fomitopsis schrenkii TaxID=2126942 RepID=S8DXB1_FOMSC|nr:hypothetical protein FOMPIDRAFT_87163 [Fomitopsis schrenkii]
MSPRASPSSSHSPVSSVDDPVEYSEPNSSFSSSDMFGTPNARKSGSGVTEHTQTRQTSELNKTSWAKEIEGKVSVLDKPLDQFLDDAFKDAPLTGNKTDKYPDLMKGLEVIVKAFPSTSRPAFGDGSHCRVPFPFEAWGREQHYTMPDIVMSLPGKCSAQWASTWQGISTVFEVKRDGKEDPVDEDKACIKTGALQTRALVQVAKSARNLLHTHRLLYAYVVGIYNYKARIYRFDHAAGVVSKEIDLKANPFPLFDFLWRFCHYQHPNAVAHLPSESEATPRPETRSVTKARAGTGCFLGMDPTVTVASEEDCDQLDELLQKSSPPQKPLTKEERASCRWATIGTEYDTDGSTKTTKQFILYRLRFLNPRLFSRATTVWDAFEVPVGEPESKWEPRAIKGAWRQLARDREDVLYHRLRDNLQQLADLEKLVDKYKNFGLPSEDSATDVDDSHSDAPPPSTVTDIESEHELNDEGMPILADELAACGPDLFLLYGLPDVESGDDLGAREARKLFDREHDSSTLSSQSTGSASSSSSEADVDALAQGYAGRPPVYGVYHRTICAWLRDNGVRVQEAMFNERSHMRLVIKTVGRPLSSFKSTKEMVTAIRDAIIGHMLAFEAGMIHRDLSEGNVMIHDGGMFTGFLLDLDYAFSWMEALKLAGEEDSDSAEAWVALVKKYNKRVAGIIRPAPEGVEIPVLVDAHERPPRSGAGSRASWTQRMKLKERTGTLIFMAIQVLTSYVAHDVCHDLESAIWLLLCTVLRHTLQVMRDLEGVEVDFPRYRCYRELFGAATEADSANSKEHFIIHTLAWEVKGNRPLTDLIRDLKKLVRRQNRNPEDEDDPLPVPLTYKSVLTAFNQALASPGWPKNDAALPFTLPRDGSGSGSESKDKKRPRVDEGAHPQAGGAEGAEGDGLPRRAAKRHQLGPSPLRNEVEASPFE